MESARSTDPSVSPALGVQKGSHFDSVRADGDVIEANPWLKSFEPQRIDTCATPTPRSKVYAFSCKTVVNYLRVMTGEVKVKTAGKKRVRVQADAAL